MIQYKTFRNCVISIFGIVWIILFQYVSLRHFYLEPFFQKKLWKPKFLFPPAGWIMFYRVDNRFATTQVYGFRDQQPYLIDPHDIFRTRTIGYDNIYRGIVGAVHEQSNRQSFCGYLKRRFPEYQRFVIMFEVYPDMVHKPQLRQKKISYQCVF